MLHVCGETYAFADAALYDDGDGFEYSWPGAGLDWSPLAGMTRTLVLSVADPGAPGAPAGLTARAVGSTRIDLAWDEPADPGDTGVTGYRIEWSADGRSGWRDLVANTGSTDRAHADTVAPQTTRHYRVSAINGQGPGSPSVAAHAATGTGEPGAPRELVAAKSATNQAFEIDLAWEEPADRGDSDITGYRIEWSADGTSNWRALAADTGPTDRTWSDVDLPSPTTRHYRVSAINAVGPGQASNTASATTDDVVPPMLAGAQVSPSASQLELHFNEVTFSTPVAPPKTVFTVTADGAPVDIGFALVTASSNILLASLSPTIKRGQTVVVTYTDPNPGSDDATGVIQDLAGHDAASFTTGEDGVPAVVNNSGAAPVAPDAPTGLMAEAAGDTAIVLTWSPPAYNGGSAVTGYLIEVSPDGTDGSFTTREANHDVREGGGEDAAIVTAYTHTGLTPGDDPPLPGQGDQRGRHGRGVRHRFRHHDDGRARRAERARRDGARRHAGRYLHADRPRLDRAGGDRGGCAADRLPHRVSRPTAPRTGRSWSRTPAPRTSPTATPASPRRRPATTGSRRGTPPAAGPARPRTSMTPPATTSSRRPDVERQSCSSMA